MKLTFISRFVCLVVCALASFANAETQKVSIVLNWVPEPEFGGIYQASIDKTFDKNGLDVSIKPGGAGAPTWQRVASGQAEFGVASADEIVIARSNEADVVGIFAIYQTCPQGIMVHAERGLKSIDQVFKGGTLALEIGLPYGKYLEKKYGFAGVKRIPYAGGIANFLADKDFAQQCFVFSEPVAARQRGSDPQTFLIADSGYNPYTGVIITRRAYLESNPKQVLAMIESLEQGWSKYLLDPRAANDDMHSLNPNMDRQTFEMAAAAQASLVQMEGDQKRDIGTMRVERWETLIKQLKDLNVIRTEPAATSCFVTKQHVINLVTGGQRK